MNEKLRSYLNQHRAKEAKEKNTFLIELGLFEKEYTNAEGYSEAYPHFEWDEKEGKDRYYRKVAISVTDDEFEEIKKYASKDSDADANNPVAATLTVIAWIIFIAGFIMGMILGTEEVSGRYHTEMEFSFAIAVVYWASALISGIMFLGFAEIIKLLEQIKNKK